MIVRRRESRPLCRAVLRNGNRCARLAVLGGYCVIHYNSRNGGDKDGSRKEG